MVEKVFFLVGKKSEVCTTLKYWSQKKVKRIRVKIDAQRRDARIDTARWSQLENIAVVGEIFLTWWSRCSSYKIPPLFSVTILADPHSSIIPVFLTNSLSMYIYFIIIYAYTHIENSLHLRKIAHKASSTSSSFARRVSQRRPERSCEPIFSVYMSVFIFNMYVSVSV